MLVACRLALLTLSGSFAGLLLLLFANAFEIYMDGPREILFAGVTGAIVGLLWEFSLRAENEAMWRFSTLDLLAAVTVVAILLGFVSGYRLLN